MKVSSVLLAEDDDDIRTLIGRGLRNRGFEVTSTADGNEAWRRSLREDTTSSSRI
jgi:DNA-binding response OmpR family regulator